MDNSKPIQIATKRLFIGIHIPITKNLLKAFSSIQNKLKLSQIKWSKPENFHVTLQFLGNIPINKIDILKLAIKKSAEKNTLFYLELQSIGTFGKHKPKIIWIGIKENQSLNKIYSNITIELKTIGFDFNETIYHPHLTLGRIKQLQSETIINCMSERLINQVIQQFIIREICLFESELSSEGPIYTILQSYELKQ